MVGLVKKLEELILKKEHVKVGKFTTSRFKKQANDSQLYYADSTLVHVVGKGVIIGLMVKAYRLSSSNRVRNLRVIADGVEYPILIPGEESLTIEGTAYDFYNLQIAFNEGFSLVCEAMGSSSGYNGEYVAGKITYTIEDEEG